MSPRADHPSLPAIFRSNKSRARNTPRSAKGNTLITPGVVSDEAFLPLADPRHSSRKDGLHKAQPPKVVLLPTAIKTPLSKAVKKGTRDDERSSRTPRGRPVSPIASPQRHEITLTPTPGSQAPIFPVPKDRGRRERKAPPLTAPDIYGPNLQDRQDRRRREPSVAPSHPPGLSNTDRTWHEREVTPLHPPNLPSYDSSIRHHEIAPVPQPPPPRYKAARGPYVNDAASLSQLGLPSLEYTFGPPPPQPLSKRIVSALVGFVDSIQAPRREHLERQRRVREYHRRR